MARVQDGRVVLLYALIETQVACFGVTQLKLKTDFKMRHQPYHIFKQFI